MIVNSWTLKSVIRAERDLERLTRRNPAFKQLVWTADTFATREFEEPVEYLIIGWAAAEERLRTKNRAEMGAKKIFLRHIGPNSAMEDFQGLPSSSF